MSKRLDTVWARTYTEFGGTNPNDTTSATLLTMPDQTGTVGQPPKATILMGLFTFICTSGDTYEICGIVLRDDVSITASIPDRSEQAVHWAMVHADTAPLTIQINSKRLLGPGIDYRLRVVKRTGSVASVLGIYSQLLYLPR